MANFQFPGPLCTIRQPWPLDKGTSMQTWPRIPGAVCEISSWYSDLNEFLPVFEVKQQENVSGTKIEVLGDLCRLLQWRGVQENDYDTKMVAAYKRLKSAAAPNSSPTSTSQAAHAPGVKK